MLMRVTRRELDGRVGGGGGGEGRGRQGWIYDYSKVRPSRGGGGGGGGAQSTDNPLGKGAVIRRAREGGENDPGRNRKGN